MIQIIERGPTAIKVCEKCGCRFSFERNDVISEHWQYSGEDTYYIVCPQCNAALSIALNIFKNKVGTR